LIIKERLKERKNAALCLSAHCRAWFSHSLQVWKCGHDGKFDVWI